MTSFVKESNRYEAEGDPNVKHTRNQRLMNAPQISAFILSNETIEMANVDNFNGHLMVRSSFTRHTLLGLNKTHKFLE